MEGFIVVDLSGKIYCFFDLYDEFEDLNVYWIFYDKSENFWFCLDNGIQFFEIFSFIIYFKKFEGYSFVVEVIDFGIGIMFMGIYVDIFLLEICEGYFCFWICLLIESMIFDIKMVELFGGK